ncbi:MAG: FAD-dependent oxidoreductase [Desulfobacterales bacterium]|jgi:NADPH-dependent 2,4-dienoyl-CoA reductase/sulfur reductase-like enzyme/rhodanese-related sulfurtransferase|nr:FAD-dependent oxidoreductase [Desulfobacterales bacterium]
MSDEIRVLVIGGVACGPKTAARLKRLMPQARITVIERGDIISYGACALPFYVEGVFSNIDELYKTPVGVARNPAFFAAVKGVQVLIRTEVLSISRREKTVRIKSLDTKIEENLAYDKLVLATGGSPVRPPISGMDLKNVWFMTHPMDAESLSREIKEQSIKKVVMVGAGFIGMEMAEAMIRRGLDVTMVEMMDQVMPGVLDADIAALAAKPLVQNGVNLILGEKVIAIEGDAKASVVRTDRREIATDAVIVAVGTRPNTQLAAASGLVCDRGVVVNEYGQTSDPDIYAGGDCAENRYVRPIMGRNVYVPLGSTANKNGRVIANHIAGMAIPFSGISCTSIVRVFDHTVGRTGLTEKQARALGLVIETTTWTGPDMPHFMSEARPLIIKMIADRRDRKLLGIQVAGMGNGAKRLDVAAAVILLGGSVDQVADIDYGYAPPFSPPLDPLAVCAHLMQNKLDGIANGISSAAAQSKIEKGEVVLLDVRTPAEVAEINLPYDSVHIPLGMLRTRAGELPQDREILAFCKVSMRGYEAQRILNAAGFDKVSFIEGGIVGWPYALK